MSSSNMGAIRLIDRVFPRMPDFYALICEQCDLTVETMEAFVKYMETGDTAESDRVRALEKQGDELKARNSDILDRAFATPMDREDIYRAIVSIDHIMNYAKTTVREMEVLDLQPDRYMQEMAVLLKEGAESLRKGYHKLSSNPSDAEVDAQAARKAERSIEKVYRRALADRFDVHELVQKLESREPGAEAKAMLSVIAIFKHREIYRHLSNGADRLARAGENLHDIVVKIS
ncbi:MAG: DUF47 family protein [Gammaproteobacteria bacterium]|nr:DUF47 family protein [Gammaproteobacteria bacterium]